MLDLFSQNERYVIGVDPGETTGVAVMNEKTAKFEELISYGYWDFIIFLNNLLKERERSRDDTGRIIGIYLYIENPNLNKPVFPIPSETQMLEEGVNKKDIDSVKTAFRMHSRRAQNVGMNKQIAKFLIEYAQRQGFKVNEVRPKKSKVDAETFRTKTGYQGRTNQHSRDAGCLVFPIA